MDEGVDPSIEAIAERAMVSRATAYRYFANVDQLILEATLEATLDVDVVGDDAPSGLHDAPERVGQVQARLFEHAQANEVQFRLFLSSANKAWVEADGDVELRSGRRLAMIDQALAPARDALDKATYRRLRDALAGMMGIESLTMMRDICELDPDAAKATMNWAVQMLVRAVLEDQNAGEET
jgi:AcrR family transcriptional regulator